jgi:hypothetical protein
MTTAEPHKIMVKVWHNAKFHYVHYNNVTSPILRRLYHQDPNTYYNPTPGEWNVLASYRDVPVEIEGTK